MAGKQPRPDNDKPGRERSDRTSSRLIKEWIKSTEAALAAAPEGHLNIKHKNGHPQYYQHIPDPDSSTRYLRKGEDMPLIRALAQKEYDEALLKILKKKNSGLKCFQQSYMHFSVDSAYENLDADRRALVVPIRLTDEQYARLWQEEPYQGMGFSEDVKSSYFTEKDERVRSKSEVIIANTLNSAGLPYKYECPLKVGNATFYPDFTILDIRTRKERYLEHFGMMDDKEYLDKFMRKISMYETNGILQGSQLIMTFETSSTALDTRMLKRMIENYFM